MDIDPIAVEAALRKFQLGAQSALLNGATIDQLFDSVETAIEAVRPILERKGVFLPARVADEAAVEEAPIAEPIPLRHSPALQDWLSQQQGDQRRAA